MDSNHDFSSQLYLETDLHGSFTSEISSVHRLSNLIYFTMNSFKKVNRKPVRKRNYSSGSDEDSEKGDAVG